MRPPAIKETSPWVFVWSAIPLLIVLAIVGFWTMVMSVSGKAIDSREALEAALPATDEYTPDRSGAIPAERMAIFLDIRRRLKPVQGELLDVHGAIRNVESVSEPADEQSTRESLELLKPVPKSMFKLAFYLAEYSTTRNELLLERGMGLGEYSWIYVIAHYSWLEYDPSRLIESSSNPRVYQDRVAGQVREMIRRHIEGSGEGASEMKRLESWRNDLELFDSDPERVPFRQNLPLEIIESLEPHRDELIALYSPELDELALMRTHRKGIKFDHF